MTVDVCKYNPSRFAQIDARRMNGSEGKNSFKSPIVLRYHLIYTSSENTEIETSFMGSGIPNKNAIESAEKAQETFRGEKYRFSRGSLVLIYHGLFGWVYIGSE